MSPCLSYESKSEIQLTHCPVFPYSIYDSCQRGPLFPPLDLPLRPLSFPPIHLQEEDLLRESMELLVMDEADLLFSYGYEENIRSLLPHLPTIFQAILLSATLSDVGKYTHFTTHNTLLISNIHENTCV